MHDKPPTFEVDAPPTKTFVSEAIDFVVDFVVVEAVREESARERADRRWGMKEPNQ
jgi:hypothetical protein